VSRSVTGKVVAPPTLDTPTSVTVPANVFPPSELKRAWASAPFSMLRMTEAGTETLTSICSPASKVATSSPACTYSLTSMSTVAIVPVSGAFRWV
jgi:hypothetical protein